jgi:hypothetical protein
MTYPRDGNAFAFVPAAKATSSLPSRHVQNECGEEGQSEDATQFQPGSGSESADFGYHHHCRKWSKSSEPIVHRNIITRYKSGSNPLLSLRSISSQTLGEHPLRLVLSRGRDVYSGVGNSSDLVLQAKGRSECA